MKKTKEDIKSMLIPSPIIFKGKHDYKLLTDYGRAVMQNKFLPFKENVLTIEKENMEQLQINNLDSFILNITLNFLQSNSRTYDNSENLCISVPPFSGSYPILLTYHLVLNHLAYILNPNENEFSKFKPGEGILLISHNIDLLQHVWNSSLNEIFLREFFPTYIVKGEKFKVFNFNNDTKHLHTKDDDTLPWIGFYRAHRKKLIEQLDKKAKVIIVDLLPMYHRKRAIDLLNWANSKADFLIVIIPSNDSALKYLVQKFTFVYAVNYSTIPVYEHILPLITNTYLNPTWGTSNSLPYLTGDRREFKIYQYEKISKNLIEYLKIYDETLQDCRLSNGSLPEKIHKIDLLKFQICNLIVPLQTYESKKHSERLLNIYDQFLNNKRIPPQNEEESSIEKNLAHHFYLAFENLYRVLYKEEYSIRGRLLLNVLIPENLQQDLILIIDPYEKLLLKEYLFDKVKRKVTVLTFKEFSIMQMRNQYPEFQCLYLTMPFPNKYLYSFNILPNSIINMISLFNDTSRYLKQIDTTFNNKQDVSNLIRNLKIKNGINISANNIKKSNLSISYINSYSYELQTLEEQELVESHGLNLTIFDDIKLLEILKTNNSFELQIKNMEDIKRNLSKSILLLAQRVEIEDFEGNKEIMFIPIDDHLKVKRSNKNNIEALTITRLKINDVWIRIDNDGKRDLFQEILNMASSTMIMKWIDHGLAIWNQILESVWKKYYHGQRFKKEVYEKIQSEINSSGGKVSQYLTVSNWFNNINIVRDRNNLEALIKISSQPELIDSMRIVLTSIAELRKIHVQLGQAISKMINIQSGKIMNYQSVDDWIVLNKDIIISSEEVSSLIRVSKFTNIDSQHIVLVPKDFTYKKMSKDFSERINKTFEYKGE